MKQILLFLTFLMSFSLSSFAYQNPENSYEIHTQAQKTIEIDGINIAYIDTENSINDKTIVLMHGLVTSSWMYRELIERLTDEGYRVIAPDLIGFGNSDKLENKKALTVENQAKIMHQLLVNHLQLKDWTHVVHDFAGPITWEMMSMDNFNPSDLVILNTFLFKKGWKPGLNIFSKLGMSIAHALMKKAYAKTSVKMMIGKNVEVDDSTLEGYTGPLLEGGLYTHKVMWKSTRKLKKKLEQWQETMSQVEIPVKIAWGEHDKFLTLKHQFPQMKEFFNVSDENAIILEGSTHIITEDSSEQIFELIIK